MNSTVSDPFLLANYSIAKSLLHARNATSKILANAHVTFTDSLNSRQDGYATVVAQEDGVHVLDISSLHPAVSHTLGPSVTFACPAVSCIQEIDGTKACLTYAVIDSAPGIQPEHAGRTVWRWKTILDAGIASSSSEKMSVVVPRIVTRIFMNQTKVVFMSPEGSLVVTDLNLNVQTSLQASSDEDRLYKVFEYSKAQCPFIPPLDDDASAFVLVVFIKRNNSIFVRILSVKNESPIADLGTVELPSTSDVADLSCSSAGYLTVLASDGLWQSYQLQVDGSSVLISDASDTISLASLTFLAARSSSTVSQEVSLLALNSSLVLLAAVPASPSTDIALLLWDLQYSVLLASNTFPIPSTLSRSQTQGISIQLVKATQSQIIILLSPKLPLADTKAQYRSSVLVMPLQVPSTSTIANAMGRMSEGGRWLSKDASAPANEASSSLDSSRHTVIEKMRAAMNQNQPLTADELFFQWMRQEEKRRATASTTDATTGDTSVLLGHEFVKQVVRVVMQPGKSTDIAYSPKIMRYLLEQQVVSALMVDEGLLPTLRLRSDWESVKIALKHVRDLPESDVTSVLRKVVDLHQQRIVASSSDAMQVDGFATREGALSLAEYLSLCVSYSCSPPALRLALRKDLPQAEDIVCVLEVLESWIAAWTTNDTSLVDTPSEPKLINGVEGTLLPPLDKIISFLQITLDSSFIALLQYPPSHQLLRKIYSHLELEVKLIDDIGQLSGPLASFAKAQKKTLAEAAGEVKKGQVVQGDWRKRRRQAFEQANLHVGLYQIEELII